MEQSRRNTRIFTQDTPHIKFRAIMLMFGKVMGHSSAQILLMNHTFSIHCVAVSVGNNEVIQIWSLRYRDGINGWHIYHIQMTLECTVE